MVRILVYKKPSSVDVSICKHFAPSSKVNRNGNIYLRSGLNELDSYDIAYGFHTSSYYHSEYIESIDLSDYDTREIAKMDYMFSECCGLKSLNLGTFNVSNVISMSNMFSECNKLIELDLSSFDTRNVKDMSFMFYCCNNLSELNLSNFSIENVIDMRSMFSGCFNLSKIICTKKFKEWCIKNQNEIGLPSCLFEGGDGIWDIID